MRSLQPAKLLLPGTEHRLSGSFFQSKKRAKVVADQKLREDNGLQTIDSVPESTASGKTSKLSWICNMC